MNIYSYFPMKINIYYYIVYLVLGKEKYLLKLVFSHTDTHTLTHIYVLLSMVGL